MKTAHVFLLTLIAIASACNTDAGEVSCLTTQNGEQCFFPSQYQCVIDPVSGDTLLAAAGTAPCNNILYATCAYSCDLTSGQIQLRADRTCPAPPSCNSNEIGCGEACYDASTVCCINSSPVILQECPSAISESCSSDNVCNFTLSGVGQLADGQLRQNFGAGAFEVSFSLRDGSLYDNRGQLCYVTSPENQIQCNYSPQFDTTDDFCLSQSDAGQFLAYNDSTQFYACAVGTGGYNIYTSQYNGVYCQPIFVQVDSQTCPPEPQPSTSSEDDSSSSSQFTSSVAPSNFPTTSSDVPAPTTSSDVPAPTTSSDVPAPTTSSAAPSNFPTTSSTPAPTTSSDVPAPTTSSIAPSNFPTTSSVRTSSVAPSTTSVPKDTCVNNPRPLPWCYFDFDFDFDSSFQNKKTCSDRSGKGHHGNFFGNPKGSSALWKLGASFFGKGQQYISINQTADLSNTFTVATYVNFYSLGEVTLAESNTWSIKVNAKAGKIFFIGKDTISFDAKFTSGVWVHIAVSIDASGNVSAFKDGESCGHSKRTSCQKHTGPIKTCKHKGSFHGCFDEYFIFNYALTLSEVESCRNKNKDECATVTTPAQTKSHSSSKTVQLTTQEPKTTTKPVTPSTTTTKKHNCGVPWVYFPCDKNHHSRCSDDSGHGNHGSWFGPTPSQCGGKIRNGLTFSGTTNQAITVSKCPLASDFSIATWVRFQISGSFSYKLASTKASNGASAGWELEFNPNTKTINFYGAGNSKASWDCSELSANSWFHLSVVVSSSSNCELFINGNSKGLKSVSRISAGGALWIANSASKNAQFKGSLDEFCIFDKALSAEQVAFARDTYTDQAQTSSWSFAATFDWGAAWEKGPLTTIKQNRIEKWWQL